MIKFDRERFWSSDDWHITVHDWPDFSREIAIHVPDTSYYNGLEMAKEILEISCSSEEDSHYNRFVFGLYSLPDELL